MSITSMGDIGGVRIILKNLIDVKQLVDKLLNDSTSNKLLFQKNYIENPKDSGYRSVHLTYSYEGIKEKYKGLRVELQIRSQIQHSWATAVEVAGTFLGENLKASQGDRQWLEFFELVSQGFVF